MLHHRRSFFSSSAFVRRSTSCAFMAACLLSVSLWSVVPVANAVKGLSEFRDGELTFFGGAPDGMSPNNPSYGTKEGACGYGVVPKEAWPYFSTMAFGPGNVFRNELPAEACGACFQIECTDERSGVCKKDSNGNSLSIIAMIADVCPECGSDHVDVQALAFEKISPPEFGRIKMRYRRVECAVPKDMTVNVMDMRPGGWVRLAVTDTGGHGAVKSIALRSSASGGDWIPMENRWGAAWELSSSPVPPLDFKITMSDGEEITADKVISDASGISGGIGSPVKFSTGVQATITDKAAVQKFDGKFDPMLVVGGGSSETESVTSESEESDECTENQPPGEYTCDQQKGWGKCDEDWMKNANYCSITCGFCSSGKRRLLQSRRSLDRLH